MKLSQYQLPAAAVCALMATLASAPADTFTLAPTADAFLASGSAGNPVGTDLSAKNFGAAGTLAIAPASSTKGEFDSIVQFNLASTVNQLNTTYGPGNWQISGLSLSLASNFAVQGSQPGNGIFNKINTGNFNIQWLSDDNWTQGTGGGMGAPANGSVDFQSIPTLTAGATDLLGTFIYTPPGTMTYLNYTLPLNSDLVTDASAGGDVSLYFSAASGSQVGYLFNSSEFGSNLPEFIVTATVVPEPATSALLAMSLGACLAWRRWQRKA